MPLCHIVIDIDIDRVNVRVGREDDRFVDVVSLKEVGEELVGKLKAALRTLMICVLL